MLGLGVGDRDDLGPGQFQQGPEERRPPVPEADQPKDEGKQDPQAKDEANDDEDDGD